MFALKPLVISGREVLPLVEGGKGISVSNGESSGAWARAGGVGTFSGVNADSYDADGRLMEQRYHGRTRRERHEERATDGHGRSPRRGWLPRGRRGLRTRQRGCGPGSGPRWPTTVSRSSKLRAIRRACGSCAAG